MTEKDKRFHALFDLCVFLACMTAIMLTAACFPKHHIDNPKFQDRDCACPSTVVEKWQASGYTVLRKGIDRRRDHYLVIVKTHEKNYGRTREINVQKSVWKEVSEGEDIPIISEKEDPRTFWEQQKQAQEAQKRRK